MKPPSAPLQGAGSTLPLGRTTTAAAPEEQCATVPGCPRRSAARTEPETSPTPPATTRAACAPGSGAAPASPGPRRTRRWWTARGGWPAPGSSRCVLSSQLLDGFLGFAHVVQGEPAGFDEVRHHRLRAPAKQAQYFIQQPAAGGVTRHHCLEDVRIADFLHAAHGLLAFQAVDRGLHGGVGRPAGFGEHLLNLADGSRAKVPERLHDLQFEGREFSVCHELYYSCMRYYYEKISLAREFLWVGLAPAKLGLIGGFYPGSQVAYISRNPLGRGGRSPFHPSVIRPYRKRAAHRHDGARYLPPDTCFFSALVTTSPPWTSMLSAMSAYSSGSLPSWNCMTISLSPAINLYFPGGTAANLFVQSPATTANIGLPPTLRRSEEHTSELQSLR